MQNGFAELVTFVRAGYVRCLYQSSASPPDTLGDCFSYSTQGHNNISEHNDVEVPEPARNDRAFSKRLLGGIFALCCNILDARGGAIMIVMELMQRSEVS